MTARPLASLMLPAPSTRLAELGRALVRPRGTLEWSMVLRASGILALLALPAVLYIPGAAGLTVFVLITVWVNGPLSPLLPATYEPILVMFGRLNPPLLIAAVGTVGTLFVEYINYQLHRGLLKTTAIQKATEGRAAQQVVRLFARRPAFTVWLCAWSPLPYWPVRILSPLTGLKVGPHLLATMLGRFPQYWLVAAVGAQLKLSTSTLAAVTGASILLALGVWLWKRP